MGFEARQPPDYLCLEDSCGDAIEFTDHPFDWRREADSLPDEVVIAAAQTRRARAMTTTAGPPVWLTIEQISDLHIWCARRLAEHWQAFQRP